MNNGYDLSCKFFNRFVHTNNIGILFLAVRSHDSFNITIIDRIVQILMFRMVTTQRPIYDYSYVTPNDTISLGVTN